MTLNKKLTLRQIEVVRAVMISGSIAGAARLLNVAQPGVSRTMKHLQSVLGINLFTRQGGRYVPAPEAREIFDQLQEVHIKLGNLQIAVQQLDRGHNVELSIGSVPSIAHAMVPRAIAKLKTKYPDLRINIELLKVEESIDFLMLGKAELICTSYKFEHPAIEFIPLAKGELVCVTHRDHPLAKKSKVSVAEIARYPLIGIDPNDPYGSIIAKEFEQKGVDYDVIIRARFGSSVLGLVRQNLGVSVLDSFSTADAALFEGDIVAIPIADKTIFDTYIAINKHKDTSSFGDFFVKALRETMNDFTELNI